MLLLHTIDKTIKLWKIGAHKKFLTDKSAVESFSESGILSIPRSNSSDKNSRGSEYGDGTKGEVLHATSKRVFSNAHTYHINSLAMNSDGDTFASADDLRINWWSLEDNNTSFSE